MPEHPRPEQSVQVVRVTPEPNWAIWRELWASRELLYFLVWRDLKVRYKQTVLGAAWAVLQPFVTMVVFSLFFGRLAKVPSDGLPYPIFSYAALVPWTFFAAALASGSNSLVGNQSLVSKIYFPRLHIPLASSIAPLVDAAIAFLLLLVMMGAYRVQPTFAIVFLPCFLLLALLTAFAACLWLSALTVAYRDFRYVVPFVVQLWLFVSPVAYPASLVPEEWRVVYGLNPMVSVVEGFRWALLSGPQPAPEMLGSSTAITIGALVWGVVFFTRRERDFADVI